MTHDELLGYLVAISTWYRRFRSLQTRTTYGHGHEKLQEESVPPRQRTRKHFENIYPTLAKCQTPMEKGLLSLLRPCCVEAGSMLL